METDHLAYLTARSGTPVSKGHYVSDNPLTAPYIFSRGTRHSRYMEIILTTQRCEWLQHLQKTKQQHRQQQYSCLGVPYSSGCLGHIFPWDVFNLCRLHTAKSLIVSFNLPVPLIFSLSSPLLVYCHISSFLKELFLSFPHSLFDTFQPLCPVHYNFLSSSVFIC